MHRLKKEIEGFVPARLSGVASNKLLLVLTSLIFITIVNAQTPVLDEATEYFLDSPDTGKYAVIMVGPTVGEVNQTRFRQWAFSLHDILARDYGYTSDSITLLYDKGKTESLGDERIDLSLIHI